MTELAQSTVRRASPITIDTNGNVVTSDRIFVHRSTKGYVCVGLGAGAELLRRAERMSDPSQARRFGPVASRFGDPYLDCLAPLAKGYNPDEARVPAGNPGGGEWTAGGIVATAASAATSLFETDSASVAAGLATIASRLSGPTAFLGTLFIPTNRSLISSGVVPGNANISFQFDRGEGVLTLSRSDDGSVLFSGRYGADGLFRDNNGNAFGRVVDGAVVLDPDALPGYASSSQPATQSGAGAQAQTDTDRDEPKLCPDPGPDRPGSGRSADAVAYQAYVSTLVNPDLPTPPGMAVALYSSSRGNDVYFDDCRHTDGVMIEAKGPGFLRMLLKESDMPWRGVQDKFLGQATDQLGAAAGRSVEWYIAEKPVADYVRFLFALKDIPITVHYVPMPK